MSTRAAFFGSGRVAGERDSDKLLDLYWSRAELKKAIKAARDKEYKLGKQIKERDGSIARLEQKLAQVENMLLDPEWALSVAVHYQLRALNARCSKRLARFAEQLKRQREKKQHQTVLDAWNDRRSGEARKVKAEFDQLQSERKALEASAGRTQAAYLARPFLLRLFFRRRLRIELAANDEALAAIEEKQGALRQELARLKQSEPPDHPGLDVSAKRSVNFMILSFAQHLFIQFDDDNFATLVRDAGAKGAGSIRYGDRQECERLLDEIERRWAAKDDFGEIADVLQKRAKILAGKALFMRDDDAVPIADSMSTLICINDSGGVSQRNASLLADDYWAIGSVLSR